MPMLSWGMLERTTWPIAIAASGPSLDEAKTSIRKWRNQILLWALPSAVPSLIKDGLEPDLVILTDPGFYGMAHLHAARGRRIPVAMPLSAAKGIWRVTDRIMLLSQPNFFEQELLKSASHTSFPLPALGTVAASAYVLAGKITSGPIVFFGLDLCYRDILSHSRPSVFDDTYYGNSGRISPHYGLCFQDAADRAPVRIRNCRISAPLQIYAQWFASQSTQSRSFRFLPSPVDVGSIKSIGKDSLTELFAARVHGPRPTTTPLPSFPGRTRRREAVRICLDRWVRILESEIRRLPDRATSSRTLPWYRNGWRQTIGQEVNPLDLCYFINIRALSEIQNQPDTESTADNGKRLLSAALSYLSSLKQKTAGQSYDVA